MKMLLALLLAVTLDAARAVEPGFTELFNGKDLTGWDGVAGFWSVKDGVLLGESTAEHPLVRNSFLIWRGGQPADFELRFDVRLTSGNSGMQYRSHEATGGTAEGYRVLTGYQCDIGGGWEHYGKMYEEGGRGRICMGGQKVDVPVGCKNMGQTVLGESAPVDQVKAAVKGKDWNAVVIIASGNHLQHFLNGVCVVDLTDLDEKVRAQQGLIGLQIHAGPPSKVEARNIRIKLSPTSSVDGPAKAH